MNDIELRKLERDFAVFNSCWNHESFIHSKKYISRSCCRDFLKHGFEFSQVKIKEELDLNNTNGLIHNLIDNKLIEHYMNGWVVL